MPKQKGIKSDNDLEDQDAGQHVTTLEGTSLLQGYTQTTTFYNFEFVVFTTFKPSVGKWTWLPSRHNKRYVYTHMPETKAGQLDHVQDRYSNADNTCLLVNIKLKRQRLAVKAKKVNYNSLPISKVLS